MDIRSRLLERAQTLGVSPQKSLSQNFLVNGEVIRKIMEKVEILLPQADWVIELGPGLGSLTEPLLHLTPKLAVLEKDQRLLAYWESRGIPILAQDAMAWDLVSWESPFLLVSNLPYSIASPFVVKMTLYSKSCQAMVLMFQKEVAQRIEAKAGDSLRGMLSVLLQTQWKLERVVDAHPQSFYPPPKVASRVISFVKIQEGIKDSQLPSYWSFLKASFVQPRKTLKNNWASVGYAPSIQKKLITRLEELGYPPETRPHQVDTIEYMDLFQNCVHSKNSEE